jgi:hypothetical protein
VSNEVTNDLYAFDMRDDGPSEPRHVEAELPATSTVGDGVFVLGDTRYAFPARDLPAQTSSLWLGVIDPVGSSVELVAEIDLPREIHDPMVDPAGTLLVYIEGQGSSDEIAYVVDLARKPIGSPMAVDTLLGAESTRAIRFSPDGSGFAAWQGPAATGEPGDFVWVGISDGVPLPPIALTTTTLAGLGRTFVGWSSDARWGAFTTDAPTSVHIVRMDSALPESTITLATNPNDDFVFAPDASHAYFAATTAEGATVVQRVALAGDEPGAPEALSPPCAEVEQIVLAADGRSLVYLAIAPDETTRHAYWVDLSGAEPVAAVRLDSAADDGEGPSFARVSGTGKHVVYSSTAPSVGFGAVLVDTATLVETPLAGGESLADLMLLPLP